MEPSSFIGIEEIVGKLSGKAGSFLLNHRGKHENGIAKSTFDIIPKSGTGELSGISGSGSYEATHEIAEISLTFSFDKS